MPVPANGVRAGSVPLDALDAGQVADLLADAAALAGALAGQPEAEAACAELAAGWDGLADLHIALATAPWLAFPGQGAHRCPTCQMAVYP
jgi:hypothetical protein